MPTLSTAADISAFLTAQGCEILATGGGDDAWFLSRSTAGGKTWHISLTSPRDAADLRPGEPLTIALEGPDGTVGEVAELADPEAIPAALQRLLALGQSRYGAELTIEPSKAGLWSLDAKQQRWSGDDIMQQALFAGQQMTVIQIEDKTFRLAYLGFAAPGFPSMAAAIAAAPRVARAVLTRMQSMIQD